MRDFSIENDDLLPLREIVFNTLRKAILRGELQPGERLMEIALAEKLGVSRTPIREAMHKLEQEGLIHVIPRRGAQVANITVEDLNDVIELRIALEKMAMEKACQRIVPSQIEELEQAAEIFETLADEGDRMALAQADEDFHECIYRAAGNRRLLQVLRNLREQMYRYRIEYLKHEQAYEQLAAEHREMTQAIRSRDVEHAQQLCVTHLENQRQAILARITSSNPFTV